MKSIEESMRELMAFCEQQQKRVEKQTAVSPKGWRRSLQRAIAAAYDNVYAVLNNMTPADNQQQTEPPDAPNSH